MDCNQRPTGSKPRDGKKFGSASDICGRFRLGQLESGSTIYDIRLGEGADMISAPTELEERRNANCESRPASEKHPRQEMPWLSPAQQGHPIALDFAPLIPLLGFGSSE
jgi:hypothetical protein